VAPRPSFNFFTRGFGQASFDRLRLGQERIGLLLEGMGPMLTAYSAPLSAVDEDNRLLVMAHVFQQARAGPKAQACMALDTKVRLSDGTYCPVQTLTGKTVASTDGGTAWVVRVHRYYLSGIVHRLVVLKGNWITEITSSRTKKFHTRLPPDDYHGPQPGMWTQAHGRQWWLDGRMQLAEPMFNPPT